MLREGHLCLIHRNRLAASQTTHPEAGQASGRGEGQEVESSFAQDTLSVDPEIRTSGLLNYLPPIRLLLTSGREETDSKLLRFSALVGDRSLGLLQLLESSDSLCLFPCSKQKEVVDN